MPILSLSSKNLPEIYLIRRLQKIFNLCYNKMVNIHVVLAKNNLRDGGYSIFHSPRT